MQAGQKNLITDVLGLYVGNAEDEEFKTGVTVLTSDNPFTAGVNVMGGAPGTRETDLLAPDRIVQKVDAITLSGGSVFGLDAASGVVNGLLEKGKGYRINENLAVPIVPTAILFDLLNGGSQSWATNPYKELGQKAYEQADVEFLIGGKGAGFGAETFDLRGGLGSASAITSSSFIVGALVAVNSFGTAVQNGGPHFWAAPFEINNEFGGLGAAQQVDPHWEPDNHLSMQAGKNTTIAIVATDACLDQAQATRLAIAAHSGIARAIVPSHTPYDGDAIFSVALGQRKLRHDDSDILELCHAASMCLSRAIARGIYEAEQDPSGKMAAWKSKFPEF